MNTSQVEPLSTEQPQLEAASFGLPSPINIAFLALLAMSCTGNIFGPIGMEMIFPQIGTNRITTKLVVGSILIGLLLSEFSLIAYWASCDSRPIAHRMIVVSSVGVLLGICLIFGCHAWPGMPLGFAVIAILSSWLFGLINWGFMRIWDRLAKVRVHSSESKDSDSINERQFGVGSLLWVMTLFAVSFVTIKLILPKNADHWPGGASDYLGMAMWLGWLVSGISILSSVVRNAVLGQSVFYGVCAFMLLIFGPMVFQFVSYFLFGINRFPVKVNAFELCIAYCITLGTLIGTVPIWWHGFRVVRYAKGA
jgi:hypothetical protein